MTKEYKLDREERELLQLFEKDEFKSDLTAERHAMLAEIAAKSTKKPSE